jgi:hypothetical protein
MSASDRFKIVSGIENLKDLRSLILLLLACAGDLQLAQADQMYHPCRRRIFVHIPGDIFDSDSLM